MISGVFNLCFIILVDCWSCNRICYPLNDRGACTGDQCYENCLWCEVGLSRFEQDNRCQCHTPDWACDQCSRGYFAIDFDYTCQPCEDFIGC